MTDDDAERVLREADDALGQDIAATTDVDAMLARVHDRAQRTRPTELGEDTPIFLISIAARLAGLHPQTLRAYARMDLVSPARVAGGGRRYSIRDIARLREVTRLSTEEGVNLAGIRRILELEEHVRALEDRTRDLIDELAATYEVSTTSDIVQAVLEDSLSR